MKILIKPFHSYIGIMQINYSGTNASSIVKASEKLKQLQNESGQEYLFLNRGVNAVCHIDLTEVVKQIDFNSSEIQHYPASKGKIGLRGAINTEYFNSHSDAENVVITDGGIAALDVCFQSLDVKQIVLPALYWGTYTRMLTIRKIPYDFYTDIFGLENNLESLKNSTVVICDPGNPLGDKYKDADLIRIIKKLNESSVTVILDCPYRRVFYDKTDTFYREVGLLENVIIVESFSKSVGLSGLRIGFVHSSNSVFIAEIYKRVLYATNGINSFSQVLVEKLLLTEEGKRAVTVFKKKTVHDIGLNIDFLKDNKLLASDLYNNSEVKGIFVVVKKTEEELLNAKIGCVPLSYFTEKIEDSFKNYSRISVSVPHDKFVKFFTPVIQ